MAKECTACIHKAVCKTAESCDGYVPGCKHFKEGWISVKDRLPEKNGEHILVCYSDGWICDQYTPVDDGVTHWMPLPQPPKGETIYCKDCENLMFSDCYGECAKGHKGIVKPNDTCEHAKRKPPKGE